MQLFNTTFNPLISTRLFWRDDFRRRRFSSLWSARYRIPSAYHVHVWTVVSPPSRASSFVDLERSFLTSPFLSDSSLPSSTTSIESRLRSRRTGDRMRRWKRASHGAVEELEVSSSHQNNHSPFPLSLLLCFSLL